jgi:WD40 repeat protein
MRRTRRAQLRFALWTAAIGALSCSLFTTAAGAAFPGANGRIAFASDRDGGSYKIFTSAADGSDVLQLTPLGSGINTGPHFSPDGTKIVFARSSGGLQVYVMNANGTSPTNVSQSATNDQGGSWSPDGTKIVFSRADSNFNAGLVIMNADGSGQTTLTTKPSSGFGFGDFRPAWSPDGNTIAFTRYVSGSPSQIYTISPAGGAATNISNSASQEEDASWSPDSAQIAFDRKIPADSFGNRDVLRMPAAGSATPTPVVTTVADDASPAFSPDGTKIIFSSDRDPSGNDDLYTVNADGSSVTPTLITTATPTTTDSQPDWGVGVTAVPPPPPPPAADTTKPLITIDAPLGGQQVDANGQLIPRFHCTDETQLSSCAGVILPPASAAAACACPTGRPVLLGDGTGLLTTGLGPGYWSFYVFAKDAAGNEASDLRVYYVRSDPGGLKHAAQAAAAALQGLIASLAGLWPKGLTVSFSSKGPAIEAVQVSTISGKLAISGSNVIAAGSGNVIAAGGGNVVAAGCCNLAAAGPLDVTSTPAAAGSRRAKPVLLLSGGHTFDRAGTAKVSLKPTALGRKALKAYRAQALRLRRAHKRVPVTWIYVTFVVAARNGNGHGLPPAISVTRRIRLHP